MAAIEKSYLIQKTTDDGTISYYVASRNLWLRSKEDAEKMTLEKAYEIIAHKLKLVDEGVTYKAVPLT